MSGHDCGKSLHDCLVAQLEAEAAIETVTLTYDPRYADPNPVDGSNIFVGTVTERFPNGDFNFAPSYGAQEWTVCHQDIERGHVAVDPKQVS